MKGTGLFKIIERQFYFNEWGIWRNSDVNWPPHRVIWHSETIFFWVTWVIKSIKENYKRLTPYWITSLTRFNRVLEKIHWKQLELWKHNLRILQNNNESSHKASIIISFKTKNATNTSFLTVGKFPISETKFATLCFQSTKDKIKSVGWAEGNT